MSEKNYITVVFEYENGAELPNKLTKAFADTVDFEGVRITAISLEDEFIRVEEFERKLEELGEDPMIKLDSKPKVLDVIVSNEKDLTPVDAMINEAYNRDADKQELTPFKEMIRESRKYGFSFCCTIQEENDQLIWAAKLLLNINKTWPMEDVPDNFKLLEDSLLLKDSLDLLSITIANYHQFKMVRD